MAAVVLHAFPGISLDRIETMQWPKLVEWWGRARAILEGPIDDQG